MLTTIKSVGESEYSIVHRQENIQVKDLRNQGETSLEIQNTGISGATKRTCVLQKCQKKLHGE